MRHSHSLQDERTVRVIWVRHGETADNARQIVQGHMDTPLNENGIKQSEAVKDLLKDTEIDVCYTSDLQRAKRTAEIILEDHHSDTPLVVDKRIKEKYLGLMEGQHYYKTHDQRVLNSIEPMECFGGRLLHFWDALFPPASHTLKASKAQAIVSSDNGERDYEDVQQGSSSGCVPDSTSLLPKEPKDLTVLVVTHGGPIKVAFTMFPKQRQDIFWDPDAFRHASSLKFKVWNCSLSEIVMKEAQLRPGAYGKQWAGVITRFADIEHLLREHAEPKEGTQADDISKEGDGEDSAQAAMDKAAAERQYHIDNATDWFNKA